jgi:hypothetical protein
MARYHDDELCRLPASSLRESRDQEVSPVELTQAVLARAENYRQC